MFLQSHLKVYACACAHVPAHTHECAIGMDAEVRAQLAGTGFCPFTMRVLGPKPRSSGLVAVVPSAELRPELKPLPCLAIRPLSCCVVPRRALQDSYGIFLNSPISGATN